MKELPNPNITYFEVGQSGISKDLSVEEWNKGIGDPDDASGGISVETFNSFASSMMSNTAAYERGMMPGSYVLDFNQTDNRIVWFNNSFPCKLGRSLGVFSGFRPYSTRWHRDFLMPNYLVNQFESPLSYQITATSLPPPGQSGAITGESIIIPTSGFLNIDAFVGGENRDIDIWCKISNESQGALTSVPSVSEQKTDSIIFPIYMKGSQCASIIPVSKGSFVSLYGRVGAVGRRASATVSLFMGSVQELLPAKSLYFIDGAGVKFLNTEIIRPDGSGNISGEFVFEADAPLTGVPDLMNISDKYGGMEIDVSPSFSRMKRRIVINNLYDDLTFNPAELKIRLNGNIWYNKDLVTFISSSGAQISEKVDFWCELVGNVSCYGNAVIETDLPDGITGQVNQEPIDPISGKAEIGELIVPNDIHINLRLLPPLETSYWR